MKPTVSTPRKLIIDQKAKCEASAGNFIRLTAQGNRKATSRSKMMNRMETR